MRRISGLVALLVGVAGFGAVAGPAGAVGRTVVRADDSDAPRFVMNIAGAPATGSPAALAREHLAANEALYEIADPARDLAMLEQIETPETTTVRFGQRHGGVPVFGAQYLVHFDRDGASHAVRSVNGHYFTDLAVSTEPRIPEGFARKVAVRRLAPMVTTGVEDNGLVVLPEGDGILAYHFTVTGKRFYAPARYEIFVNARTASVAFSFNNIMTDGAVQVPGTRSHGDTVTLNAYQRGSSYELRDQGRSMFLGSSGEITTHDAAGTPNFRGTGANIVKSNSASFSGANTSNGAVDAHDGAGIVYEWFLSLGRNSLDGNGGNIVSTVNASDDFGGPLYNAFWNGEQMIYGNPDPSQLHPFSGDLDVVGHELSHGVIENSADLTYINQSGAMNEAYADYFGNSIDVANSPGTPASEEGFVGEDLCKVSNPEGWACPLRDLNDGKTVADYQYVLMDLDLGGVHLNSTIFAGALWDVRESLGASRADQIVYKALAEFNTPLDDFVDGRNAVVSAAQALGASASEVSAIEAAFNAKGIVSGWDARPSGSTDRVLVEDIVPLGLFEMNPPKADGARFVVGDFTSPENFDEDPMELYVGNIDGSGSLEQVGEAGDPATLTDEQADISGKKVVWAHATGSLERPDYDVHKRVLGGGVKAVGAARDFQWRPAVSRKTIVWEDYRSGQADVWMKRGSNAPTKVAGSGRQELFPDVSGDYVSWYDAGSQTRAPSLVLKNVVTGSTQRYPASGVLGIPSLGPSYITWYEDLDADGFGAINLTKFGSNKIKTLVAESSEFAPVWMLGQFAFLPPVPSGNSEIVAFADEFPVLAAFAGQPVPPDAIGRDLWSVPVAGGTPTLITEGRGDQAFPAAGSRVVWLDGGAGQTDLATD